MFSLFNSLHFNTGLLLILALLFVLFYEAVNGFHDTANAVATIIHTRAMRPKLAVIMSGIFNFLGVLLGGLSVAYSIVHLLPIDILLNIESLRSFAMIFSMLLAAIIWNVSTWYLGLPASSSHTLIGAIIGVGVSNSLINHSSIFEALNIKQVINILIALIASPIIGLIISASLFFLLFTYWNSNKKQARIHMTPNNREKINGKKKPPFWSRMILIMSAIGVSYSHGSNDGQKGIGLIMLVLISIVPAGFIINMNASNYEITRTCNAVNNFDVFYKKNQNLFSNIFKKLYHSYSILYDKKIENKIYTNYGIKQIYGLDQINNIKILLNNLQNYKQLSIKQRSQIRYSILYICNIIDIIQSFPKIKANDKIFLKKLKKDLLITVEYAPTWIIIAVALALGIGTMIGWRRVTLTIGKKIGKKNMTYAQGMSAQITAAISISIASFTGMPVSTTHILSSSVAGAMLVGGNGLQISTVKNIIIAWILTLPVCIFLSGCLYWILFHLI
ncbi:MAG: inorganic phosphate transporter [Pantoea sp. Brub]|nr:inorganic phosphate transporter [Pantoea sp. Brub]